MPFKRNVRTGEIVEVDASGRPVGQAGPPASPTFPFEGQKIQTEIGQGQAGAARTRVQTQGDLIDNSTKGATSPYMIAKARADAEKAAADAEIARRTASAPPTLGDDQRKALAQRGNLDSLVSQINRTQQLYENSQDGFGFQGLGSIGEYLPTQANGQFDTAAAGLAEQGLSAFRVPGVGSQSDAELKQFVNANKPSSWSLDSSNKERLRQLRTRTENTRRELGMPAPQWRVSDEDRTAANNGLAVGFRELTKLMQNMTPEQKRAALQNFNANPTMQSLKSRAGFRDPGSTKGAPRKAPTGGAKFLGFE